MQRSLLTFVGVFALVAACSPAQLPPTTSTSPQPAASFTPAPSPTPDISAAANLTPYIDLTGLPHSGAGFAYLTQDQVLGITDLKGNKIAQEEFDDFQNDEKVYGEFYDLTRVKWEASGIVVQEPGSDQPETYVIFSAYSEVQDKAVFAMSINVDGIPDYALLEKVVDDDGILGVGITRMQEQRRDLVKPEQYFSTGLTVEQFSDLSVEKQQSLEVIFMPGQVSLRENPPPGIKVDAMLVKMAELSPEEVEAIMKRKSLEWEAIGFVPDYNETHKYYETTQRIGNRERTFISFRVGLVQFSVEKSYVDEEFTYVNGGTKLAGETPVPNEDIQSWYSNLSKLAASIAGTNLKQFKGNPDLLIRAIANKSPGLKYTLSELVKKAGSNTTILQDMPVQVDGSLPVQFIVLEPKRILDGNLPYSDGHLGIFIDTDGCLILASQMKIIDYRRTDPNTGQTTVITGVATGKSASLSMDLFVMAVFATETSLRQKKLESIFLPDYLRQVQTWSVGRDSNGKGAGPYAINWSGE